MSSSKARGFTLLEVLLVALIMGLLASAVVVRMSSAMDESQRQLHKLAALLSFAQERALLSGKPIGITINAQQLDWLMLEISESNQWNWDISREKPLLKLSFKDLDAELVLDGLQLEQQSMLQNDADYGVANMRLFERDFITEQKRQANPQILILPSGEVTPFELHLRGADSHWQLRVDDLGQSSIEAGA